MRVQPEADSSICLLVSFPPETATLGVETPTQLNVAAIKTHTLAGCRRLRPARVVYTIDAPLGLH